MIRDYTKRVNGIGVRKEAAQNDPEYGELKATFRQDRQFMTYTWTDARTVEYRSLSDDEMLAMLTPQEKPKPVVTPFDALSDADLKTKAAESGVKYDAKNFDRAKVVAELAAKSK